MSASFDSLPKELDPLIYARLSIQDLRVASQVCKWFNFKVKPLLLTHKKLYEHYLLALSYLKKPVNPEVCRENVIWFDKKRIKAIYTTLLSLKPILVFSQNPLHEQDPPCEMETFRGNKEVSARIEITDEGVLELRPLEEASFNSKYGIYRPAQQPPPVEFSSLLEWITRDGFEKVKNRILAKNIDLTK